MANDYVAWLQKQLQGEECSPGAIDGLHGPKTAAALLNFQRKTRIKETGRADDATLQILRERQLKAEWDESGDKSKPMVLRANGLPPVPPPWMRAALNVCGRHAMTSNDEMRAWLASPDHRLADPAEIPFAGDFLELAMQQSLPREALPSNPNDVASWAAFGRELTGPAIGAVGFTKSAVFFYAGENGDQVAALGVNTRGRVSVVPVAKTDVVGYRWPATYALGSVGPVLVGALGMPGAPAA